MVDGARPEVRRLLVERSFPAGTVRVEPMVAAKLAPTLVAARRKALEAGEQVDPAVSAAIDALELAGEWFHQSAFRLSEAVGDETCETGAVSSVMTTSETAVRLGVTDRRVQQLAATGALPARRSGRSWTFNRPDVECFGASQEP